MARKTETVEVLPSPKRLTEVLRDVGYDFVSAVADIVDNSIAANASRIDVEMHWDGPDSWVRIADNGTGMDGTTVNEALRFGSERSYRPDDLGKFGLGLKTASLSQCRRLCVASRIAPKVARIEARRFDLDRIISTDSWEIEVLSKGDRPTELVEPLQHGTGTVVLWTQLDRVLGTKVPRGERAHGRFLKLTEQLEQHLAMVFHRFIEGDVPGRRRKLTITVAGNRISPWNPFAIDEPKTQNLPLKEFDLNVNGVQGIVTFDPYVLPAQKAFSSEAAFERMSGPNRWNHQQGFYIYRANRMIQSGGWSRMRAADEHNKLARVALDFFPELDPAFGINIAKMRVHLPSELQERLRPPIQDLIKVANKAYREKPGTLEGKGAATSAKGEAPLPLPKPKPVPLTTGRDDGPILTTGAGELGVSSGVPWPPPPLTPRKGARTALEDAADGVGEKVALDRIVKQLRADSPEVARDLGW